jgi:hypothetical protein
VEESLLISVLEKILLLYLIEIPVPQPVDYISRNLQRARVDAIVLPQRPLGSGMGLCWKTGPLCSVSQQTKEVGPALEIESRVEYLKTRRFLVVFKIMHAIMWKKCSKSPGWFLSPGFIYA